MNWQTKACKLVSCYLGDLQSLLPTEKPVHHGPNYEAYNLAFPLSASRSIDPLITATIFSKLVKDPLWFMHNHCKKLDLEKSIKPKPSRRSERLSLSKTYDKNRSMLGDIIELTLYCTYKHDETMYIELKKKKEVPVEDISNDSMINMSCVILGGDDLPVLSTKKSKPRCTCMDVKSAAVLCKVCPQFTLRACHDISWPAKYQGRLQFVTVMAKVRKEMNDANYKVFILEELQDDFEMVQLGLRNGTSSNITTLIDKQFIEVTIFVKNPDNLSPNLGKRGVVTRGQVIAVAQSWKCAQIPKPACSMDVRRKEPLLVSPNQAHILSKDYIDVAMKIEPTINGIKPYTMVLLTPTRWARDRKINFNNILGTIQTNGHFVVGVNSLVANELFEKEFLGWIWQPTPAEVEAAVQSQTKESPTLALPLNFGKKRNAFFKRYFEKYDIDDAIKAAETVRESGENGKENAAPPVPHWVSGAQGLQQAKNTYQTKAPGQVRHAPLRANLIWPASFRPPLQLPSHQSSTTSYDPFLSTRSVLSTGLQRPRLLLHQARGVFSNLVSDRRGGSFGF